MFFCLLTEHAYHVFHVSLEGHVQASECTAVPSGTAFARFVEETLRNQRTVHTSRPSCLTPSSLVTHRRVATSIVASGIVALSKLAVASPATAQTDSNVTTPTGDDVLLGATEAQVNTYRAQGFRIIDVDRIASNSTEECRGALSPDLVVMSCGQALDLPVYIDHMSEPEVFALIASLVVGFIGWGWLATRGAMVDRRLWSTADGRMRPGGGFGCLATIFACATSAVCMKANPSPRSAAHAAARSGAHS